MNALPQTPRGLKYAPQIICICDEWECCGQDGGTWQVSCRFCGQTWPCGDYQASHTPAQIRREKRYTNAREYPPWPEAEDRPYEWIDRKERWVRSRWEGKQ